jgi:hypothetical protein
MVDTQLIMRHMHVEEEIAAAIALYLDIINLFLAYVPPPPPNSPGNGLADGCSILRILNSTNEN